MKTKLSREEFIRKTSLLYPPWLIERMGVKECPADCTFEFCEGWEMQGNVDDLSPKDWEAWRRWVTIGS